MLIGKRYEQRIPADVNLQITSVKAGLTVPSKARDLSPRGAFVETDVPLGVGDLILCEFELPGALTPFSFFAEVVREDTEDRDSWGFGVEFMFTTTLERLDIRSELEPLAVSSIPVEWGWFH